MSAAPSNPDPAPVGLGARNASLALSPAAAAAPANESSSVPASQKAEDGPSATPATPPSSSSQRRSVAAASVPSSALAPAPLPSSPPPAAKHIQETTSIVKHVEETTSIVKRLFFVTTASEVCCARYPGKHSRLRYGPRGGEMLPPLPLRRGQREVRSGLFRRKTYRDSTLQDCLDDYFSDEISERRCEGCGGGKTTAVSSRPWLTSLPPVLVVQLKRFEFSPSLGSYAKIQEPVEFPLRGLDMAPYLLPSTAAAIAAKAASESKVQPKGNIAASKEKQASPRSSGHTATWSAAPSSSASSADAASTPAPSAAATTKPLSDTNPPSEASAAAAAAATQGLHSSGLSANASATGESAKPSSSGANSSNNSSARYDLFAVVMHSGSSHGGHYTAYARRLPLGRVGREALQRLHSTLDALNSGHGSDGADGGLDGDSVGSSDNGAGSQQVTTRTGEVPAVSLPPAASAITTAANTTASGQQDSTTSATDSASQPLAPSGVPTASSRSESAAAPAPQAPLSGKTPAAGGGSEVASAAPAAATSAAGDSENVKAAAATGVESEWAFFDDGAVLPATEADVAHPRVASLAYLLFYAPQEW